MRARPYPEMDFVIITILRTRESKPGAMTLLMFSDTG